MSGWVGIDLDGTLARHEPGSGVHRIGAPIMPMVERVRAYLAQGYECRIFTARVATPDPREAQLQAVMIQDWLERECRLPRLRVTCRKDFAMLRLYDDRAVGVVPNTGQIIELENANA